MRVEGVERICPLCEKDNNCKRGQGGCWCDTVKVPKYIFHILWNIEGRDFCSFIDFKRTDITSYYVDTFYY